MCSSNSGRSFLIIEEKREQNGLGAAIPQVNRGRNAGPGPMRQPTGVDPSAAVA